MLVMVVAFIILKYGDRLCLARTVPKPQNYEIEDQSSDNTTYLYDERESVREYIEVPEIVQVEEEKWKYDPEERREKYEYAVWEDIKGVRVELDCLCRYKYGLTTQKAMLLYLGYVFSVAFHYVWSWK